MAALRVAARCIARWHVAVWQRGGTKWGREGGAEFAMAICNIEVFSKMASCNSVCSSVVADYDRV